MKHTPLTKPTYLNWTITEYTTYSELNLIEIFDDLKIAGLLPQFNTPFIGLVKTETGIRVGGRFFPSVRLIRPKGKYDYCSVVLAYKHEDEQITRATVVHETAHFKSYICECNHVPSKRKDIIRCRYKGEHDKDFYKLLEPMYRISGIPTYAARIVEGSYNYPRSWNRDNWY